MGSQQWCHVLPRINTNFFQTVTTPKGDVLITMFLSINGIVRLVSLNECVVQTRSTYYKLCKPYSYIQKQDMFDPSAVSVFQLIRCQFMSIIFYNQSGQWYFWYIHGVSFVWFLEVRRIYIKFIACNFLLFFHNVFNLIVCSFLFVSRNLFNLIGRGLFNWFTCVFLIALIILILL